MTAPINATGIVSVTLEGNDTVKMMPGIYDMVILSPNGYNQSGVSCTNMGNIWIQTGKTLVNISQDEMTEPEYELLKIHIMGNNSTPYSVIPVNIEDPWIHVNPIGNHTVGETFDLHGTTNLPAGENILVRVWMDQATPGMLPPSCGVCPDGFRSCPWPTVKIKGDDIDGVNSFVYRLNTTGCDPYQYMGWFESQGTYSAGNITHFYLTPHVNRTPNSHNSL
jgi:hypothetical protein